jgi:hypothetical protein
MSLEQGISKTSLTAKRLGRAGFTGITIGTLSLLACELPFLLALVGLGGLSVAVSPVKPHPLVEWVGIAMAGIGVVLLVGLTILRRRNNKGGTLP